MESLSKKSMKLPGKISCFLIGLAIACLSLGQPARMAAVPSPNPVAQDRNKLLNEKWSPAKLYAILNSSDPQTRQDLYRAAFAAGPVIIPKLQNALKDDRTATFAAQTLAYIGGSKAIPILASLVNDPRNLDLRRFYYGALGGSDNPHDIEILLSKIRNANHEPDRTVSRDAILALSTISDASLVPKLNQAEEEVTDPVVSDDINTAAAVIGLRTKYLASPAGKDSGRSVKSAIRTYFMPALETSSGGDADHPEMHVEIHVRNLTYSPDRTRALAYVDFENPQAVAAYRLVVAKKASGWKVVSVWLGSERDRQPQAPTASKPK